MVVKLSLTPALMHERSALVRQGACEVAVLAITPGNNDTRTYQMS